MADSIASLIEEIKASSDADRSENAEVHRTLNSIDIAIKQQAVFTELMATTMSKQLAMTQEAMRDAARKERLAVDPGIPKAMPAAGGGAGAGNSASFEAGSNFVGMFGAPFTSLLGSLAATGLAIAGLRGWEVGALKNIGKIGDGLKALVPQSITKSIDQKFINVRAKVLRTFGMDPSLGAKDADTGKRGLKTSVLKQINGKFDTLRTNVLKTFGLGADGKPIAIKDADGLFTKNTTGKFWSNILDNINKVLRPLKNAGKAITDFASGAGAKLFEFIKGLGGGSGGFLKLVGKILKPIGFLFSAFDGVTAFMDSDKDGFIAKLGDGIGAFLGDFIGAPFDLLKAGVAWIVKKIFGVEVNEDGTIPEGQGLPGFILAKLNSFSFEESIGAIVSGLFQVVQDAVDWVKLLFTDPTAALQGLWTGIVGEGGLIDILYAPIDFVIDWVSKKFGFREEDAPPFSLRLFLIDTFEKAEAYMREKFTALAEWFKGIPDRVRFAAEEFFVNLKADMKIGFIALTDWFKNLPNKILAAIMNVFSGIRIELPNNKVTEFFGLAGAGFNLIDPETVAAANAAANAPSPDSTAKVNEILAERDKDIAGIEKRRKEAEAQRIAEAARMGTGDPTASTVIAPNTVNNGGNTSNATTNNYYSQTGTSQALDPADPRAFAF